MCLRTASAWVHDRRRELPWKQRHDPKSLTGKPAYSALPSQTPQIRTGSRRAFGTTSQSCFEKQRTRPKVVRQACCSRWVLGRSRRGAEQILLFEPLLHSAHLPGRILPRQCEREVRRAADCAPCAAAIFSPAPTSLGCRTQDCRVACGIGASASHHGGRQKIANLANAHRCDERPDRLIAVDVSQSDCSC